MQSSLTCQFEHSGKVRSGLIGNFYFHCYQVRPHFLCAALMSSKRTKQHAVRRLSIALHVCSQVNVALVLKVLRVYKITNPCAGTWLALSQRCHNLSQLTLFATVPKQVLVAEIASIFSEKAQKLLISQLKIGEFLCRNHQKGTRNSRSQIRTSLPAVKHRFTQCQYPVACILHHSSARQRDRNAHYRNYH